MMEYAKTAKQTAKKNGINFINNKLIADFSAVKTMIHNNIEDIKFFIDIINIRTAVYNDGSRKYGVITADAARLTAYKNNTVVLQFDYNIGKFKNDYSPIFTIDIA